MSAGLACGEIGEIGEHMFRKSRNRQQKLGLTEFIIFIDLYLHDACIMMHLYSPEKRNAM